MYSEKTGESGLIILPSNKSIHGRAELVGTGNGAFLDELLEDASIHSVKIFLVPFLPSEVG